MKLPSQRTGGNVDVSPTTRFIWTRLAYHQASVNTPENDGQTRVLFSLNRGQGKPVVIDLTALTLVELEAFRQTVLIATEAAAPICKELDLRAQKEMENGNDANPRCYRPLPTVVIRTRAFREYSGRILDGRQDVLSRMQLNILSGGGYASSGSDVDEQGKGQQASGQDNP